MASTTELSLTPCACLQLSSAPCVMKLLDVDGDGMNELVVATSDGRLAIYKGLHCKRPWRVAENLGTISCFCITPPPLADGGVPQQAHPNRSLCRAQRAMHVIDACCRCPRLERRRWLAPTLVAMKTGL